MSSGNPEDLLRSALEKIVFFECRVSQLEGELAAARALASREKESSAAARTREVELESNLSRERSEVTALRSHASELAERVRLLESERGTLLAGMVEQARLSSTAEGAAEVDGPDLAGFIAELRAEIERLQRWKAAAEKAGVAPSEDGDGGRSVDRLRGSGSPSVPAVAARLEKEGRLGIELADAARLQGALGTRAERALYASSVDDLASTDADRRRRAVECLGALRSKAAAPLLAAAVGRERQPEVKVALLSALAALREPAAAEIALRECRDPSPAVRAAALEAASALRPDRAGPVLTAALADQSALVRRRAVLLLGFAPGREVEEALAGALADRDAGVARAAALALSGRTTSHAQAALARALDHREPTVRCTVAQAVSRWAGEPIDAGAPAGERRRAARRIAEKLATVDADTLRQAVVAAAVAPTVASAAGAGAHLSARAAGRQAAGGRLAMGAQSEAVVPANIGASEPGEIRDETSVSVTVPVTEASRVTSQAAAALAQVRTAVAVVDPLAGSGPLEESILAEVRAALRGRSAEDLYRLIPAERAAVEAALATLVARGALTRRGARFFVG